MADMVVIGAGVVGAATAHALAQAGAAVEVLEAREIAGGVSAATFAMDISRLKTPRALFDLSVHGAWEHERLRHDDTDAGWLHPAWTLEWTSSVEARARIEQQVSRLQAWGYPAEWLSAESACEIEPALRPSALEGQQAALYRGGAWYEPRVLAQTLLDRARRLGATVHAHEPVTAFKTAGARISEITTAAGRQISADVIVNCAGPQAAEIAALAGVELPLARIPGLVAVTTPTVGPGLRTIIAAEDLHARPHGGGRVLVHSWRLDAELSSEPPWNIENLARRLLEKARSVLSGLGNTTVQAAAVGVRPIPTDGLPIVGLLPGLENLYTVVAHSAVHLAPMLGRLAAQDLTADHHDDDALKLFRPARLWATDQEAELVDESTRTMLAEMSTAHLTSSV